jgi:hypothetical protein
MPQASSAAPRPSQLSYRGVLATRPDIAGAFLTV